MIDRYSRPDMAKIWNKEQRFNYLLQVELAVLEAFVTKRYIPLSKKELNKIKKSAFIDVKRIEEIEKDTGHDVIAFLKSIEEKVGEPAKYIHKGLTSSDVLDTALALQLRDAIEILEDDIASYLNVLKEKVLKYKYLPMIGRTHGIHAEPITLGLKFLSFYSETLRNFNRLRKVKEEIAFLKISGAVGTYSSIDPEVEKEVARRLKLKVEPVATQIIPRDRYAYLLSVLAIIAAGLERLATEIRNLQRTEVNEVFEPFGKKQKGSSAMPHKRNPILCERLSGLARMLRAYLIPSLENITLWHERDISHSSVERIILPDSFILLDYMLNLAIKIVSGLEVNEQALNANLYLLKGLFASQQIMLLLIEKGLARSYAYDLVQKQALKAYHSKRDFKKLIKSDQAIRNYLTTAEIESAFDLKTYLKHIDTIYKRFQI